MENMFSYVRMHSSSSIGDILQLSDEQRLSQLIQLFVKYQMTGKRYESKAWHHHFRRIATNPVIFFQCNVALFYEDNQHDRDTFQINEPTIIHGDLHTGQFQYYIDEVSEQQVFIVRKYQRVVAPFTWDLKRLATNLALIAYQHGLNDVEITEILQTFLRQYIDAIQQIGGNVISRMNSFENEHCYSKDCQRWKKRNSISGLMKIEREMFDVYWPSIDTVSKLMILGEKLATTTARIHSQPPLSVDSLDGHSRDDARQSLKVIRSSLATLEQQERFVIELCHFALIYTEIAQRDHQLFFRHFRNARSFHPGTPCLQIPHPLANARRTQILIIGGGIGGMATALCFARSGIQVRLLERSVDFGEVGAGMQLAPNASRILDRLGVLEALHRTAVFPQQIVWMDALTGERLTAIDLGKKFLDEFQYPYIVVHRADLFQVLYQACRKSKMVTMETNRSVISIDERPKSIMIECADGMRYDCDFVIAADGLWSTARKFVHDDGKPISVGYVTYRGTIPIEKVSKEAGVENVQFWIGPDLHLVQYPIRRGELFNQAAVFRSKKLPDDSDQWGTKEELNERFSVGCVHVKKALQSIQTNFRWPVYE